MNWLLLQNVCKFSLFKNNNNNNNNKIIIKIIDNLYSAINKDQAKDKDAYLQFSNDLLHVVPPSSSLSAKILMQTAFNFLESIQMLLLNTQINVIIKT